MKELRTTVAISSKHRELIEQLKERDILGFNLASTTDIFMLAVALGLNEPQALKGKDPYIRTEYISKAKDKALFECVAIGSIQDDSELDKYSDLESSLDVCEQCAENGFQILSQMATEADWDKETFEKRVSVKLNLLYSQYVEGDI